MVTASFANGPIGLIAVALRSPDLELLELVGIYSGSFGPDGVSFPQGTVASGVWKLTLAPTESVEWLLLDAELLIELGQCQYD